MMQASGQRPSHCLTQMTALRSPNTKMPRYGYDVNTGISPFIEILLEQFDTFYMTVFVVQFAWMSYSLCNRLPEVLVYSKTINRICLDHAGL